MKKWRAISVLSLFFLVGAAIISRLVFIQIIKGDYYKALARGQQGYTLETKGERGEIFFSSGQPLAVNAQNRYLFLFPPEIKETEQTVKKIAAILNLKEEEITKKIEENSDKLVEIKEFLTEEEKKSILALKMDGIYIREGIFREYPQKEMASHLVGFFGGEEKGQYGLEGYYEKYLQGKEIYQKEAGSSYIASTLKKGSDVILTIDYNIQFFAEKLLKKSKEDLNIDSGQIIVIDPSSGKILALADFPNFDPNNYSQEENYQIFQNSVTQKFFEPGSIFKPITMAAAIDQGKVDPQTKYVDEGFVKIGGWVLKNYDNGVWGERTMTEVLERSINTGAVFAESKLGSNLFLNYVKKFGLFEPTGIDLQGEVSSENKELKKGYEINFATASFGQGIEVTPIQMVRAFCVIANGGKLVKPYVVQEIKDGENIEKISPKVSSENIISLKTASQVAAMMVSVVENGYGKQAKIPGYYIAGKTGTAQMSWSALGVNEKGYSEKTWQSFVGFAPAFNPKFLILVKLDNPSAKTAEYSAVPVFRDLAKYIIDYLRIPPEQEINND